MNYGISKGIFKGYKHILVWDILEYLRDALTCIFYPYKFIFQLLKNTNIL